MGRRSLAVLAILVLVLTACQVAEETGPIVVEDSEAGDADTALGSPQQDWPRTLPALRAFAAPEVLSWQDGPVLADVTVWLDEDARWQRVRLTYVAPDAERMLTYRSSPEDLRIERPRLAGLQLPELPGEAVEDIEPFPDDVLEPAALAGAAERALADCGAQGEVVEAVLYATGAPAAWDGTEWSRNPTWRATVVTQSAGVTVDPRTGTAFAPLTCVEPFLADAE
ncbi:MAG TPA: hypothetical protein VMM13_03210 [Euzebya sp.]|nr:hypothetical protein [Euzebya sp.]